MTGLSSCGTLKAKILSEHSNHQKTTFTMSVGIPPIPVSSPLLTTMATLMFLIWPETLSCQLLRRKSVAMVSINANGTMMDQLSWREIAQVRSVCIFWQRSTGKWILLSMKIWLNICTRLQKHSNDQKLFEICNKQTYKKSFFAFSGSSWLLFFGFCWFRFIFLWLNYFGLLDYLYSFGFLFGTTW